MEVSFGRSVRGLFAGEDGGELYSSDAWLELLERVGHEHRYLTVADGPGRAMVPVCAGEQVRSGRYAVGHLLAGRLAARECVVAAPQAGYRNAPRLAGGATAALLAGGVLDAFPDRVTIIPYVSTDTAEDLRAAGVQVEPLVSDAWLTLPGSGFDDYAQSLAPKRRRMVRAEMQAAVESGVRYSVVDPMDCADEAAALFVGQMRKYDANYRRPASDYIEYLKECAGLLKGFMITARFRGSLLGCAVFFLHGGTLWGRMLGIDHRQPAHRQVYFQLVFYRAIELAYEIGARALHLGIGSYAAKTQRGAVLETLWVGLAGRDPELVAIARDGVRERRRADAAESLDQPPSPCAPT
ncbi:GNAT family N-acetyltransferase [Acrocarpospora sp. B8E8]|uniref:GNAT family N-acetyltransferase n=1 Tax=Acrocarpospora sp. B8E8 TaxID=3153572 RepID=UPI00325E796F